MWFKMINDNFKCENCWELIEKHLEWSARNHCPYCFISLHLDDKIPWDRKSTCKWKMYPIEYVLSNGTIKITFKCEKCWHIHRNKITEDDYIWNLDKFLRKDLI